MKQVNQTVLPAVLPYISPSRQGPDATDWYQVSYQMLGFDRVNFVSDVTGTIPQDDACQVTQLNFEGNGVQVRGRLTIRVKQHQRLPIIQSQLRTVRGMVSVQIDYPK